MQHSSVGERSSVFLRWLAVSLYVRQSRGMSSAPPEVLLADQTRDEETNQEILAAISTVNAEMLGIRLVWLVPASAFFLVVIYVHQASAFWH